MDQGIHCFALHSLKYPWKRTTTCLVFGKWSLNGSAARTKQLIWPRMLGRSCNRLWLQVLFIRLAFVAAFLGSEEGTGSQTPVWAVGALRLVVG